MENKLPGLILTAYLWLDLAVTYGAIKMGRAIELNPAAQLITSWFLLKAVASILALTATRRYFGRVANALSFCYLLVIIWNLINIAWR